MTTEPTTASPTPKRRRTSPLRRGAVFERAVKERLETAGAFVVRSAGSRSPVDLVAIFDESAPPGLTGTLAIQVKMQCRALPRAEREALIALAGRYAEIRVFHAWPGGEGGSVVLDDLVSGERFELPAADAGVAAGVE